MVVDGQQSDAERAFRKVLDKQEIYETLVRYCRGIDRGDAQLVLSAFHEGAMDNHSGVAVPVAERMAESLASKSTVKASTHNICNVVITVDGDVAASESYLIGYVRSEHEGRELDFVIGARYVDRFERRNGSWRIAHRTVVYDWTRADEVRAPPAGLKMASYVEQAEQGTRSLADYSYQVLGRL